MGGAIDDPKASGRRHHRDGGLDLSDAAVLVVGALNDGLGFFARVEEVVVEHAQREADAEEPLDAPVARADCEADRAPNEKPAIQSGRSGVALGQEIEGREGVLLLAAPPSCRPVDAPTPRKLKRSTARPASLSALAAR